MGRVAAALVAGALVAGCASTVQTRSTATGPVLDQLASEAPQAGPGAALPGTGQASAGTPGAGGTGQVAVPGAPRQPTATGPTAGPVAAGATLPETGPGWDKKAVYIGVPTEEDLSAVLAAASISFNPGSIQDDVRAIVAHLNARGGLFGRKLVAVFHDNAAADVGSNPEAVAQENCAAFTQDRRVVLVLNPIAPIETEAFLGCMRKTRTPLLSIGYSTYDDAVHAKHGPYLFTTIMPNVSRFVPAYIPALKANGYFTGWDAVNSAPAQKPAVVGVLEPDTAAGRSIAALHKTALARAGVKLGMTYFYRENVSTYSTDMSSAVLQFRNAGVTHVMDITNTASGVLVFSQTANQQRYYPRYGLTSWLLPDTAASTYASSGLSKQLNGSVAIGWTPGGDVNAAHDPGRTPQQKACDEALARQGVRHDASKERYALMVGWALCDDINLLVAAARRSGGLSPDALAAGMAGLAFRPAATFSSALTATNHALPGSYRALKYDPGCECYAYVGPERRLL